MGRRNRGRAGVREGNGRREGRNGGREDRTERGGGERGERKVREGENMEGVTE